MIWEFVRQAKVNAQQELLSATGEDEILEKLMSLNLESSNGNK